MTAQSNGSTLQFVGGGGNSTLKASMISVEEAVEDRSWRNFGLRHNGTVTKSAVATGAELVCYSGFSSSNYLSRPLNSDFEFGTGDWSLMGWIASNTSGNSTQHPIQIGLTSGGSSEISILRATSSASTNVGFRVRGDSGAVSVYPTGGKINNNQWAHFVLQQRGSTLEWWVNGILLYESAQSNTGNIGFNTGSDLLRIGHGASTVTNDEMKLALIRVTKKSATPSMISKIYADEGHLFKPNAKATLYSTVNGVVCLAHDTKADLLHVGTSAGRSVFQGLSRIDNTTDAVGDSISAVNNMVVED
jgi:hypothetical protein